MTIWKYEITPRQALKTVPLGAKFLSAHPQGDVVCLWFMVDPNERRMIIREFGIIATGEIIDDDPGKFLGTVMFAGGSLVFHIFEKGQE